MDAPPPPVDAEPPEPPMRPPIAQAALSVNLLAFGAASEVAECLARWQEYLATLDRPFEIVLIGPVESEPNPAPTDVRRIDFNPERGLGTALADAVRTAEHPLVVLATADRQYQPADLQALLGVIDHVDLAVGCRTVAVPLWRRVLGWTWAILLRIAIGIPLPPRNCTVGATPWRRRWLARWVFGLKLGDPESPFRLGRRDALRRIVFQSHGPFALIEQLAKANHLEFILTEEPVSWASPATPLPEPVPFGPEARALFRRPDFGPAELHIPPPEPDQSQSPSV
jgi:hypothetical protein